LKFLLLSHSLTHSLCAREAKQIHKIFNSSTCEIIKCERRKPNNMNKKKPTNENILAITIYDASIRRSLPPRTIKFFAIALRLLKILRFRMVFRIMRNLFGFPKSNDEKDGRRIPQEAIQNFPFFSFPSHSFRAMKACTYEFQHQSKLKLSSWQLLLRPRV